jgi:NAD(P)-dependent dehydrogenase (short-subunit alcohol dehydrogenase family)
VRKLLPTLQYTAGAAQPSSYVRIISLTPASFRNPPSGGIAFSTHKTTQDTGALGPWTRYGQSKLANILCARELARYYAALCTVSAHPALGNTALVTQLSLVKKALEYLGNMSGPEEPGEGRLFIRRYGRRLGPGGEVSEGEVVRASGGCGEGDEGERGWGIGGEAD